MLSNWGRSTTGVSLPNEGENILTDYTAGLFRAERFLLNDDIKNDGKKKVVIFISDGIPTLFIEGDWISEQEAGTLANVGDKTGSRYYPAAWPTYGCPDDTYRQFWYFVKDMNRAGFT